MDHSHKEFSASNSPKDSATTKPSISGETDENHIVEHNQMNSKTHNSKKPVMKHFMSPTISATSKATVPKKKILAEINETLTSFDLHPQKSPKFHLGTSNYDRSSSRSISAYNCSSESDDGDHNTKFSESSLKPYDPLTNYLSPRPKYLRYNPNRRREIFSGQEPQKEKEDVSIDPQKIVDKNSSECGSDSFSCPPQDGSDIQEENQEMHKAKDDAVDDADEKKKEEKKEEDDDDETEEFEEENRWILKGLLKFLLLLVVITLSTSYISSVNTTTPSLIQRVAWGVRDGCYRIQKHLYEAMSTNLNSCTTEMEASMWTDEAQTDFLEANKQNSYLEFGSFQMVVGAEDGLVESNDGIVKNFEPPNWENEDIPGHGYLFDSQTRGMKDGNRVQVEFKEVDFDLPGRKISESKVLNGEMDTIEENSQESQQVEGRQTLENFESFGGFNEPLNSKSLDDHCAAIDSGSTCANDKPADLIFEVDELGNNNKVEQVEGIFRKKEAEEMMDKELERTLEIMRTMEDKTLNTVETVEGISFEETRDEMMEAERLGHDEREDTVVSGKVEIGNNGPDEPSFETKEKPMKPRYVELGPVSTASIFFSIFSIVVAFVVYVYHLRAIQVPVEISQAVTVPSEEPERKEKLIQVHHHIEVKHREIKPESIIKPSSMLFSTREAVEDISDIQAPEVTLLGELVIGKVSSSFKSCSRKSKMTESEESSKTISHAESRAYTFAPSGEVSIMDTASSDSPSYGSFTAEKKILKKERGTDGGLKILTTPVRSLSKQQATDGDLKILTTPVRRSSRIRNRTVTSP